MSYVLLLADNDTGVFDDLNICLYGYEEELTRVKLVKTDTIQEAKGKLMEYHTTEQLFRMGIYSQMSIRLNHHYQPNG